MNTILLSLLLLCLTCSLPAQRDTIDTRRLDALNYGHLVAVGPEVGALFPQQYTFNLDYRLWIRAIPHKRRWAHDHTLLFSAGYCNTVKENMLRLRAGDLLDISVGAPSTHESLKLGVIGEYLVNAENSFVLLNLHVGYKRNRFYYYIGVSRPVSDYSTEKNLRTNMQVGISYFLFERYSFIH